jgi:hypothetical protein
MFCRPLSHANGRQNSPGCKHGSLAVKSTKKKSPGKSAKEYYIFVFDTFSDAEDLHNVKAVKKFGKLTTKQHDYLQKDFKSHNLQGRVRFIPIHSIPTDGNFMSKMLRGKIEKLLDQENLHDCYLLPINTAINIANEIRTNDGCEHENVMKVPSKRPVETSPKSPGEPSGNIVLSPDAQYLSEHIKRHEGYQETQNLTLADQKPLHTAFLISTRPILT